MYPKTLIPCWLFWLLLCTQPAQAQNATELFAQAEQAEAAYYPERAIELYQKSAELQTDPTEKTITQYRGANLLLTEKRRKEALALFLQIHQEAQKASQKHPMRACFGWGAGYQWYQQQGGTDSAIVCLNRLKQSLSEINANSSHTNIQKAQAHHLYASLTGQLDEKLGNLFSAYYHLEQDGAYPMPFSLQVANELLLSCLSSFDAQNRQIGAKNLQKVQSKLKNTNQFPYYYAHSLIYESLLYANTQSADKINFAQAAAKAEDYLKTQNLTLSPLHIKQLYWYASAFKDIFIDYPKALGYFSQMVSIHQKNPTLIEPSIIAGVYRNMGYITMDNRAGDAKKNLMEGFGLVKKAWQLQLTDSFNHLQPPFYPDLSQRDNININFSSSLVTLSALHYGYQRIYELDKSLTNKIAIIKTMEANEQLLRGQLRRNSNTEQGQLNHSYQQVVEHYHKKAITYKDFYNNGQNLSDLLAILEVMQLANGRQSGLKMSRISALKAANGSEAEIAELERLAKQINQAQGKLAIAQKEQDKENTPKLSQALTEANLQQEQYLENLKRKYPAYSQFINQLPALKLEQIQPWLKESALLITLNARFLNLQLVISSDTVIMVDKFVDRDKYLHPLIDSLQLFLKNPPPAGQEQSHQAQLARLLTRTRDSFFSTQAFFESKKIKHIIIVPDQLTAAIPFELLPTEAIDSNQAYQNWPYAVKKYSFQYLPTLPFWAQAKEQSRRNHNNGKILAFAPTYQKGVKNPNRTRSHKITRNNLVELFGTKEELSNLGDYYYGDFLSDQAAHEAAFKQKSTEPYAVMHLAMHGLLESNTPELSSLAFSETADTSEDNFLTALEIANLSNRAQLVVLSACETGTGKQQAGEGILSLAQYFLYGGAPAVIATRWQVNDQSTAFVMQNFYKYLYESQTIKASLRQAQLDYLQQAKGRSAHPFYWAAFINVGHTDKTVFIAHRQWRNKYYIGAGIASLLIVGLGLGYLRKKEKLA